MLWFLPRIAIWEMDKQEIEELYGVNHSSFNSKSTYKIAASHLVGWVD